LIVLEKNIINDVILDDVCVFLRKILRGKVIAECKYRKILKTHEVHKIVNVGSAAIVKSSIKFKDKPLINMLLLINTRMVPHLSRAFAHKAESTEPYKVIKGIGEVLLQSLIDAISKYNKISLNYESPQVVINGDSNTLRSLLVESKPRNSLIDVCKVRFNLGGSNGFFLDLLIVIDD